MYCSKCGSENPDGKKFCGDCGAPLTNNCPRCGSDNPAGKRFCGDCGSPLSNSAEIKSPDPSEKRPSIQKRSSIRRSRQSRAKRAKPDSAKAVADGERRQLTVMFCDLVGSTAISQRLDPEELRELLRNYHQICAKAVGRFDGFIAKYLGDGLLIYFGYPTAHEDDPQRAVRAGLGLLAELEKAPTSAGIRLQARIGIHTGLAVVGEIGVGAQREAAAVLGETPNLAARLQEAAEPSTIVTSPATHKLVQGFFQCEDCGPLWLKGISEPVRIFRVLAESGAHNRFEVAVRSGLTALVGREDDVGLLLRQWEQAQAGQGRAALLSGEPGIGKSRLVQELGQRIGSDDATRLEFQFSPYHQNSPLHPLIQHLERLLGFERDDSPEQKREKLKSALSSYRFVQADTLALIAALLSLPPQEDWPPLVLSPQKQKQRTQEALVGWLLEETENKPAFLVWEDLHWADPSSLELIGLLIDQVATTPMLMAMTFRPDFTPPWPTRSHVVPLALSRLAQSQSELMVAHVAHGKALPLEVIREVIGKTDGVPLFVEELTKMVLESELLREIDGRYELSGPLPKLAIPATLHDSLMARLDRLIPVKEVAQLGATIGREFSYELIRAISPMNERSLDSALARLVQAEVVFQKRLGEQAHYIFKHALIQDAAYRSLLKSRRRQYHQQIARALEGQFGEIAEAQPELVAHHYTEAGLVTQAIPYWQQAGQRAIERSANIEAIGHLTKGLEVLKSLAVTPEHVQQEITLQITLGVPLIHLKGYAAPEVERTYTRARELCQQAGETPQLFSALWGLWLFYACGGGHHETARELGEQLLHLANSNVHDGAPIAHYALGCSLFLLGDFTPGREHLEHGLALYNPQSHGSYAFVYSQDPRVVCSTYAAWSPWFLGYPDQALKRNNEMLTFAQDLAHPFSLAFALNFAAMLHQFRGDIQAAQEWAEAAVTRSTEQGFPFWLAPGTIVQGWVLAECGQAEQGIAQIRQGLTSYQATGANVYRPYFLALLAEACRKAGRTEEGLDAITEALNGVQRRGERYYEAELYRLLGELTLQSKGKGSEPEVEKEPERCFWKAIEIARRQRARSWELRAVISLSRLWQQQGKQADARHMLGELYNWFTEGFDTKDLREAKALLQELA